MPSRANTMMPMIIREVTLFKKRMAEGGSPVSSKVASLADTTRLSLCGIGKALLRARRSTGVDSHI